MAQTAVFVDTNVFLYVVDRPQSSPLVEASTALFERVAARELLAYTSSNVLQEYAHIRRYRGGKSKSILTEINRVTKLVEDILISNLDDLRRALKICDRHAVDTMDAIHIATALRYDLKTVITADRRYSHVGSIEAIDPRNADRVDELCQ